MGWPHYGSVRYGVVSGGSGRAEAHSVCIAYGFRQESTRSGFPCFKVAVALPYFRHGVGRVLPVVGGRGYHNRLANFGTYHEVDALDTEEEKLVEDLHDAMSRAKYTSNKGTYLPWLKYFKDGAG